MLVEFLSKNSVLSIVYFASLVICLLSVHVNVKSTPLETLPFSSESQRKVNDISSDTMIFFGIVKLLSGIVLLILLISNDI